MAIPAIVWQVVTPVLRLLLALISPLFAALLKDTVRTLYAKALTSHNPADDALVQFLAGVLGISLEGVTPAPKPISELAPVNAEKGAVDGLVAMATAASIPSPPAISGLSAPIDTM